jgi:hypothetical protein
MAIYDAIACGNAPHSSTICSGLASGLARKFEQELCEMVARLGGDEISPARFGGFMSELKTLSAAIGRETLTAVLESLDPARSSIEIDGQRLRYRGMCESEWLTPFGRVPVLRRTYRGDGPGSASAVPLDDACGMRGRYMTPDVEEMAAFGSAMLTAKETEQLLAKTLPEGPSATAIQNAVRRLGVEIEEQRTAIEDAVEATPDVAWREAGVASVSIYGPGEVGPEKLDTRYLARMPESGMVTLLKQVADQVVRAKAGERVFREFAVICDGKDTIWSAATTQPVLHDAVWILDFYHASENLMKAAKAIFGDDDEANRWHGKHRDQLQLDPQGCEKTIRSMLRYRRGLPADSAAWNVVKNAIKYFRFHRDRMRYAEFLARGLPIGSGPVESAAKNIVQARLKRSGMRWSRDGGQHVLDLRTMLKSGRWEPMWNTLTRAA